MTHDELVAALRSVEGLKDVGKSYPNFHFKSRPFLHFHVAPDGRVYADVRLSGRSDFEEHWADTPEARRILFALVDDHVASHTRQRANARLPRGRRG